MNIHKNARLTPIGRERLVQAILSGQTPKAAAQAAGVCPRTARKADACLDALPLDVFRVRPKADIPN